MTRIRSSALLLGLALAPLVACVDDGADAPMLILRNLAPGDGCALDPSADTFISGGRIESVSPLGYVFTPVIRNDLQLLEGEPTGPKTIFLESARVELSIYPNDLIETANLDAAQQKFMVPVSGTIEPGGGTAALAFTIVPADVVELIGDQFPAMATGGSVVIDARIQMVGKRGGSEVRSNVFRYPVEVCVGCVQRSLYACDALPDGFEPGTGGACNMYQDGILDCCNGNICPAAPPPGT